MDSRFRGNDEGQNGFPFRGNDDGSKSIAASAGMTRESDSAQNGGRAYRTGTTTRRASR